MHDRHCGEIEHVSCCRVKAAHSALTQNDVVVAFGENVFGAQQQLVDGRRHPAFEQHRLFQFSNALEQRIILHVARADLDAVGVFGNEQRAFRVHCLGHDRQAALLARACEELQTFLAKPLEGIRRAARLERAAPERGAPGPFDDARGRHDLLFRLD